MTDELKPVRCGCGGEAESALSFAYEYYVMCHKCGTRSDYFLKEVEAIEAWNKAMGERTAKQWTPVTEALPEEKGEYLVSYHPCHWDVVSKKVSVGNDSFRGKTTWAKKKYQKVIAWMPLPEPWRGE